MQVHSDGGRGTLKGGERVRRIEDNPDVQELRRYNRAAALAERCTCGHPRVDHAVYCGSLSGVGERCLKCGTLYGNYRCPDFHADPSEPQR